MRESPNGMASASQADSRGFDSRLSLHKKLQGPYGSCRFFVWSESGSNHKRRKISQERSTLPRLSFVPAGLCAPKGRKYPSLAPRRTAATGFRKLFYYPTKALAAFLCGARETGENDKRSFFPLAARQADERRDTRSVLCSASSSNSKNTAHTKNPRLTAAGFVLLICLLTLRPFP